MSQRRNGRAEQVHLDAIREVFGDALRSPYAALHVVNTFTHGRGIQLKVRSTKIGPIVFPVEGGSLSDVLAMFGSMLDEHD